MASFPATDLRRGRLGLRRSWCIAAALLLAAVHMLAFDRGLGGDGWAGFVLLESIFDDGDLWLENNHRGVLNGLIPGRDGHLVSQYPPGVLIVDALPVLAGRALDRALPAGWLGGGVDLPPVGRVPRGVFLSAAMITLSRNVAVLLGLAWIALALLRLEFPHKVTAAAVALTFFGGPLVFYSLVGMTHAPTFALSALLLLLLVRQREQGSVVQAFAAGAVIAGAVLLRYSAVALLVPAILAVRLQDQRRVRSGVAFACGFLLPLLPLPLWWKACYGNAFQVPYGGQWELTAAAPWNVLFAPVHGAFHFHPALVFAGAGLVFLLAREARCRKAAWGVIGSAWIFTIALVHGWWSEWTNVGGYGQRFFIDALPAVGIGFASWLHSSQAPRLRAAAGFAGAIVGWVLFFSAVGGLVAPRAPYPWPQRLTEYATLVSDPPDIEELVHALRRASFLVRTLSPR